MQKLGLLFVYDNSPLWFSERTKRRVDDDGTKDKHVYAIKTDL